jgi:hypothetical protein
MESRGCGEYLDGLRRFNMHQHAVLAGGCFWGMQDLIRKLPGVVSTCVGYIGENPASYKSPSRDVSPSLGANDERLDYIDTPKRGALCLAWCGDNGFKPIAIGVAA